MPARMHPLIADERESFKPSHPSKPARAMHLFQRLRHTAQSDPGRECHQTLLSIVVEMNRGAVGWTVPSIGYRCMLVSIGGSGRLLRSREELGECLGKRLGMGQGRGVPGARDLLYPRVGDVVDHVASAGGEEGPGVRSH